MGKRMTMAIALAVAVPGAAFAQSNSAYAPCAACHSVKRGENRLGPHLAGIVGRPKASVAGFNYSQALKAKKGVWTEADLIAYITNPKAAVPGTRMMSPGVKDPAKRAALIAYLKSLR
jgi:cytochrome c